MNVKIYSINQSWLPNANYSRWKRLVFYICTYISIKSSTKKLKEYIMLKIKNHLYFNMEDDGSKSNDFTGSKIAKYFIL